MIHSAVEATREKGCWRVDRQNVTVRNMQESSLRLSRRLLNNIQQAGYRRDVNHGFTTPRMRLRRGNTEQEGLLCMERQTDCQ